MNYIGIDPGLSGAIAVIFGGGAVDVYPIQSIKVSKGRRIDRLSLHEIFIDIVNRIDGDGCTSFCCIEKQAPRPMDGKGNAFKGGVGYGILLGMLQAMEIPHEEVSPNAWKKAMLGSNAEKGDSIIKAQSLFPTANLYRTDKCKTKSHDIAEALLLAEHARRMRGGK